MRRTLLAAAAVLAFCHPALAKEGYDQNGRPLVCDPQFISDEQELIGCRNWVGSVTQPTYDLEKYRRTSCCGVADAFITDDFETDRDGHLVAIVTEDYPGDGIAKGTKIPIPDNKVNNVIEDKNPTKHGVVFVSTTGEVLCYFGPWGN